MCPMKITRDPDSTPPKCHPLTYKAEGTICREGDWMGNIKKKNPKYIPEL